MAKEMIAVWFSCGAASAVAAHMTLRKYGKTHDVRIINNPIAEEDADNQRFLHDVERWLDHKIEFATNSKYPTASCVDVWAKRKFMSGVHGAPCTMHLKKEARQQWEGQHNPDWHVLGFTAEEKDRHDRFVLSERGNVIPVLIDYGLSKNDCYMMLREQGIRPPRVYEQGYPNANCIGCVRQHHQHTGTMSERCIQIFLKNVQSNRANLAQNWCGSKGNVCSWMNWTQQRVGRQ